MTREKRNPPRSAEWILRRLTLYNAGHSLNGDIKELYDEILNEKGHIPALLWFWLQTILSVFTYVKLRVLWALIMTGNYLKITFRTLRKHKGFSFINVFGLGLSMAICLMIIVFIMDQKDSDRFHENKDRIVWVYTTDAEFGWDVNGWATTPGTMAPYLRDNFPFIDNAVRVRQMGANVLRSGRAIPIGGVYAEASFLKIFSFPLRNGNPETALSNPYSIVLTEESALRLFGDENPMNRRVTLENKGDYIVTGVLKNIDKKSHFRFDALVSFSTLESLESSLIPETDMNDWSSLYRYYTYVLLKNKGDISLLKEQIPQLETALIPETEKEKYGFKLQTLSSINLGLNLANKMPGTKPRLDIFYIPFLAALVMFLACFNYIILSVARSLKRTKEIGLRKVIGASRNQVVKLFLSETATVSFLSLIAGCLLILWLIPVFNGIDAIENTKMQINIEQMKNPVLYAVFILFALAVSIVAGLYPALYISSFMPVNALQGISKIKGFSQLLTRKILMTVQFSVSLISIIFIIYFYQLHTYWVNFDRGILTENTVGVYLRDANPETFRNEILTKKNVTAVSFSNHMPVYGGGGDIIKIKSEKPDEPLYMNFYNVGTGFIPNFGLEVLAGRNFSENYSTDKEKAAILNELAVRYLRLGSPPEAPGKTFSLEDGTQYTVIGVVKDFYFRKYIERPIKPLVLFYRPDKFRYANIVYTKGKKEEMKEALPVIWKKFDKVHPVSSTYFDEEQEEINNTMKGTIGIAAWGCGFVILIALFGLLGMATYTTEMRTKEIGIRKVLGSSVTGSAYLLSKSYIRIILYAAVIALPGGYFLSDSLFQFFAYRPELSLWVPPAALIFILVLSLITIGSQTVKAAMANPVTTIREE